MGGRDQRRVCAGAGGAGASLHDAGRAAGRFRAEPFPGCGRKPLGRHAPRRRVPADDRSRAGPARDREVLFDGRWIGRKRCAADLSRGGRAALVRRRRRTQPLGGRPDALCELHHGERTDRPGDLQALRGPRGQSLARHKGRRRDAGRAGGVSDLRRRRRISLRRLHVGLCGSGRRDHGRQSTRGRQPRPFSAVRGGEISRGRAVPAVAGDAAGQQGDRVSREVRALCGRGSDDALSGCAGRSLVEPHFAGLAAAGNGVVGERPERGAPRGGSRGGALAGAGFLRGWGGRSVDGLRRRGRACARSRRRADGLRRRGGRAEGEDSGAVCGRAAPPALDWQPRGRSGAHRRSRGRAAAHRSHHDGRGAVERRDSEPHGRFVGARLRRQQPRRRSARS